MMAEEATSWVELGCFVSLFFRLLFRLNSSLFILGEILDFLIEEFVSFRPLSQFALRSHIIDGNLELQVMKTAVVVSKTICPTYESNGTYWEGLLACSRCCSTVSKETPQVAQGLFPIVGIIISVCIAGRSRKLGGFNGVYIKDIFPGGQERKQVRKVWGVDGKSRC
jgi:hypothetical protein